MRNRFLLIVACSVCVGLLVGVSAPAVQTATGNKMVRYDGRVTVLNKDAHSITIQAKTGVVELKYDDNTKFTYRNKPGTIDDLKEGRRIVALLDPGRKEMLALRVDVREGK